MVSAWALRTREVGMGGGGGVCRASIASVWHITKDGKYPNITGVSFVSSI
jgi:hypothetical protein